MSAEHDAVEATRRKKTRTPEQTARAILKAYDRAQGKHPRSHTAADYRALAVRLAPIVARALLALSARSAETTETVAEALWQAESTRATGKLRRIEWTDEAEVTRDKWRYMAREAIAAHIRSLS